MSATHRGRVRVKRRALVIPREMVKIGKLDFDTTSSVGIIEREVKTRLVNLIEPNLEIYQAKAQLNQAYHGLVLSCFMILDPEIKAITSIILSVLLDQDLHLEPIETAEIIDQRESLQIGDNFDNYVQQSTKVILNGKWALSALAQRIQPGCGLYLSGVEVNSSYLTLNEQNEETNDCVLIMNSVHPKILKLHSQFSSVLTDQLTS